MKYEISRVASWFNRVIELNQKMLIVFKISDEKRFFLNFYNTTELFD
jgi:hypothetical protein